jgi:hypothetical protein
MMRSLRRGGLAALLLGTLFVSAARPEEPEGVQQAIDRGVVYLKGLQNADGTWPGATGATALAGLTLLECGVAPDDPAVQKAASAVRQASVTLTHTYSLSLAILFFDRLGDPKDGPLIESMTVRLLAGQNNVGGWTYSCPNVADAEMRRLQGLLQQRSELVAAPDLPRAGPGRRTVNDLAPEIRDQLKLLNNQTPAAIKAREHTDDNSNTQFATLALWVARRYGLPTEGALARVNTRFRSSQNGDGGWAYKYRVVTPGTVGGTSTATMTCSGLLGLAIAHGAAESTLRTDAHGKEPARPAKALADPLKDLVILGGLVALGNTIGQPVGKANAPLIHGGRHYYFLWSLERVAVAYDLKTICGKDWYGWGAEILLANQRKDGSWQGDFADGGADTCFALLFLRRANLARDLTATLQGKVQDPGEAVLKAEGAGGTRLVGSRPKLAINDDDKRAEDEPKPAVTEPKSKPPSPPADQAIDSEAGQLSAELVNAPPEKREQVLERLRDSKGGQYTDALAAAIPRLSGEMKTRTRDALAERLVRMKSATLGDKLVDSDAEVRRAAALALAMKDDRSHFLRLVELLEDPDAAVARAAHAALRSLSGQDFGPDPAASRPERAEVRAQWKEWWVKHGAK